MKRIISILLVTAMLIGLVPVMVTAAADETSYQYAVITSTNGYKVRMRGGPSKVYDPIDTYPVGTTVVVLQNQRLVCLIAVRFYVRYHQKLHRI